MRIPSWLRPGAAPPADNGAERDAAPCQATPSSCCAISAVTTTWAGRPFTPWTA